MILKFKFNSHLSHNPDYDILEYHLDGDTFITYCLELSTGKESMELYRGINYVPGSTAKSYSRKYDRENIPPQYIYSWNTARDKYFTDYITPIKN